MRKEEDAAKVVSDDQRRAAEAKAELVRINNVVIEDIRVRSDMEEKAKMQALEDDKLRAEVVKRIDEAEKARASPVPDAPTATIT